jgi:hypothetical protein
VEVITHKDTIEKKRERTDVTQIKEKFGLGCY